MGKIIWLTGLSGSGKTVLAVELEKWFKKQGVKTAVLDGDVVRDFFEGDLGYSRCDRIMNVKRIGFTASMLSRQNITVIVANIAPYYEVRDFLRKKLSNYIQIYLEADIASSLKRKNNDFYDKYAKGELKNFVGVDDKYDIPRKPDLKINTEKNSLNESLNIITDFLKSMDKL